MDTRCQCPACHVYYRASQTSGGHCAGCHATFNSQRSFDRHRYGPFTGRQCLTPVMMLRRGWVLKKRGWEFDVRDRGTPPWANG